MIQSIDRAIRVLTALQGARRMSLSELAARLELAPSTTHGIVRSLVEHGMVVQERGSSRYQLGPAVLQAGQRLPGHPRAEVEGDPLGRGPGPSYRPGGARRRTAHRRRRDHPSRAAPGREPADARGRHRHPRARERPGQGDAGVPAGRGEAGPRHREPAQHDRRDAHVTGGAARPARRGAHQRARDGAGRGGARRELPGRPGVRLVRRGGRRHRRRDPLQRGRVPARGARRGPRERSGRLPRAGRALVAPAPAEKSTIRGAHIDCVEWLPVACL